MNYSALKKFLKKNWPGNLGKEISQVVANVSLVGAVRERSLKCIKVNEDFQAT
jgi:hypothetical protein